MNFLDQNNELERLNVLKQVTNSIDPDKGSRLCVAMEQGQFVIAAMVLPDNPMIRVGYVVQIREKAGQFGSKKVFMRLSDGTLITHENQAFWSVGSEQESLIRSVFATLPEDEDYSRGYSCQNKVHKVGFIIKPGITGE